MSLISSALDTTERIEENGGLFSANTDETQDALLDFVTGVPGDVATPGSDLVIDTLIDMGAACDE